MTNNTFVSRIKPFLKHPEMNGKTTTKINNKSSNKNNIST